MNRMIVDEVVLDVQVRGTGELISAAYTRHDHRYAATLAKSAIKSGFTAALSFTADNEPLLVANASIVRPDSIPQNSIATVSFSGENVDQETTVDLSVTPPRVTLKSRNKQIHQTTFNFTTWSPDQAPPEMPLPTKIEAALAPFHGTLQSLTDFYVRSSNGHFAPESGRPPAIDVQAMFADKTFDFFPAWVCHAYCWGTGGAAGVACCAVTCPKTACFGCVVCAAVTGAAASACSDAC
jgi:hypothetical protein